MRRIPLTSILLLAAAAHAAAPQPPAASAPAGNPRQHLSMDAHWLFTRGDPASAQDAVFDDRSWRTLDLPHDWSVEGPYDQANPMAGNGGYLPAGVGWYRRHFVTPASVAGRIATVQFDGIYMNADVYLNGHAIGHQPYGYTTFTCDLNQFLAPAGQDNVLAVRVNNTTQPNSRWYTGSGIYRHVWMDITNQVHLDRTELYATTPKISSASADVRVAVKVLGGDATTTNITVVQELLDPSGAVVASVKQDSAVAGGRSEPAHYVALAQTLTVPQPQLWTLEKPVLYTVRTRVLQNAFANSPGPELDVIDTPIGIRSIEYDVNKGFLLNGVHTKMLGMCLHADGGAFGAAVPEDIWERRLKILKTMGCNAIRCSHNPPAPEFLDLCDRLGILVMDEAFDEWSSAKGQLRGSYATIFNDWSAKDITAMLRRDRNHPSIVMWSIGNEIPQQASQRGVDIAKSLTAICHAEDPTRPVTSACDNVHSPNPTWPAFLEALDIGGYNYVDRWNEHREIYFSDDREKYPARKFVGTEDVCVGGVRGSYFGAAGPGRGGGGGAFGYASSMIRAEQLWKFNAVHDYVIGYFMWTGIDYLGEAGAWPRKGSSSGTIDTCGFPKDGFYFYQSQWTTAPMVHLLPHWNYPGEKGAIIPVVVYSNCQQVELQLNGKSFGTKSLVFPRPGSTRSWNDPTPAGSTGDLHLTWDVPYEPGTIKVIGRRGGQIVAQDEITTATEATTISLKLDKTAITTNRGIAQIETRILDAADHFVPTANNPVTYEVEGPAKVLAVDNGDQSSHDSYQTNTRPAFNGMAFAVIQSNGTAGHVKVTAKSGSLRPAVVEFDVTAAPPVPAVP